MKMNNFVKGFTAIALSTLVLAACGSDDKKDTAKSSESSTATSKTAESSTEAEKVAGGDLQDGTYKLEEKNESNGYRATFEMTVKDGKITESKYDNINADGKSKTEDKDYEKNMKDKTGVGPAEFIPELNESFVKAQSASGVEVVTGATHSTESFQNYAQQLIQAAQIGDTDTIEIDNGAPLKDGTYSLKEKNNSNGYHTTFSIVVKDGKVTESKYDNVNDEGKSKTEDAEYNTSMKEKSGTNPETYIPELNDEFVKAMNEEDGSAADVEVVTGATHSSHSFVIYAEQLINAAEKGDTKEIVVDNIVTK
ncbi:extracellular electron transfer flavoprotein PplA [Enterococcus sp. 5H]|uniref:extracellular electron transfer flavoprotein PplA n=1 Tax=Enterococcus sp. 5H TaxID=1229490 RepID=UPI002302D79A|nr:extracellular electron transfer flavoprotein PplA [Enterococcus sp. 5H]MDA9471924.1 Pheromone cAD1 precursor lipoprotein Cad [Enterococcus sp. 5H]